MHSMDGVTLLNRLKEQYGPELELTDENGDSVSYRIASEFSFEGKEYAVLELPKPLDEQDIEVFRVLSKDNGELELETISDDEEWETIAELYDEMLFSEK